MKANQDKMRFISKAVAIAIFMSAIIMLLTIVNSIHFAATGSNFQSMQSLTITAFPKDSIIFDRHNFIPLTAIILLYQAIILTLLLMIYSIFRDISREYTPFKQIHVTRLKWIAGLTVLMGVCTQIAVTIADYYKTSNLSLQLSFDTIIPSIMIYCVALILAYGCELQRQSDETL